jgi:Flagellar hook-length control protein FliK
MTSSTCGARITRTRLCCRASRQKGPHPSGLSARSFIPMKSPNNSKRLIIRWFRPARAARGRLAQGMPIVKGVMINSVPPPNSIKATPEINPAPAASVMGSTTTLTAAHGSSFQAHLERAANAQANDPSPESTPAKAKSKSASSDPTTAAQPSTVPAPVAPQRHTAPQAGVGNAKIDGSDPTAAPSSTSTLPSQPAGSVASTNSGLGTSGQSFLTNLSQPLLTANSDPASSTSPVSTPGASQTGNSGAAQTGNTGASQTGSLALGQTGNTGASQTGTSGSQAQATTAVQNPPSANAQGLAKINDGQEYTKIAGAQGLTNATGTAQGKNATPEAAAADASPSDNDKQATTKGNPSAPQSADTAKASDDTTSAASSSSAGNASSPASQAAPTHAAPASILNRFEAERASLQALSGLVEGKGSNDPSSAAPQGSHNLGDLTAGALSSSGKIEAASQRTGSEIGQNSSGQQDSKSSSDSPTSGGTVADGAAQSTGSSVAKDNSFTAEVSAKHQDVEAVPNATTGASQTAATPAANTPTPAPLPQSSSSSQTGNSSQANATGASAGSAALAKAMNADLPATQPAASTAVNTAGLVQNGGKVEMRVDLTTDALGSIQLHAVMQDGRLGASINVENHDAHTLLTSELPALQQSLLDKNVQVEHISVLDSSVAGDSRQQAGGSGTGGQNPDQGAPAVWRTWPASNLSIPGSATPLSETSLADAGRLSVRA